MLSRLSLTVAGAWCGKATVAEEASGLADARAPTANVLLSVITRNRFWPHALSMISLLESVRQASQPGPTGAGLRVAFELHVIDDASDRNVKRKRRLVQDLVERGLVQNYTRLPRRLGTVGALRSVVDVVLGRPDVDYWLHSDDDVLVGAAVLGRAVRDYQADLLGGRWGRPGRPGAAAAPWSPGGGLLAIFVNSWLDEQLSMAVPAFGPYAVAPFLGGAAYLADRATLVATGNPWARALEGDPRVSPHDAHVLWLTKLLPERGLPIWVRWKEPYQCQHLGNVQTLNFGRQPTWEPMWAFDHRTKRLIEVDGYESVALRAALWAGGEMLRGLVWHHNARASLRVELPHAGAGRGGAWSEWAYPRLHAHYVEIGTSDFDALVQRHAWRREVVGFSVEPARAYFERLPAHGGPSKTLLNVAVSDHDGYEDLFSVRPELVAGYLGAEGLCRPEALREAGLAECLPGWVRGASSIKKPPEGVRQLLGSGQRLAAVLTRAAVPSLTYGTLMRVYGVGSVDVVKIDAEGFDHIILRQVVDFAALRGVWPWQIQFEKNMLSDWQALDAEVLRLQDKFHYKCHMTGVEGVSCWRSDATH